jgi:hypothetical protein
MRKIVLDGEDLAVWIGPVYKSSIPKVLVLGESRYDDEFTDRMIIEYRIAGQFRGGQRRTFTNFERAVLGHQCSDAEACTFWQSAAFCNFNRGFFPGRARVTLDYRTRTQTRNSSCLRRVLQKLKPTHVVVWGKCNWDSIYAGSPWTPEQKIPSTTEPFCTTTIDGHEIFFTRVRHPSAAFSSRDWARMLSEFLTLSAAGSRAEPME